MRIIANDVTPEMGSEGSNPSLSVVKSPQDSAGFFGSPRSDSGDHVSVATAVITGKIGRSTGKWGSGTCMLAHRGRIFGLGFGSCPVRSPFFVRPCPCRAGAFCQLIEKETISGSVGRKTA